MDRTSTVSEPDIPVEAGVSDFSVAALTAAALALVGVLAWDAVPPLGRRYADPPGLGRSLPGPSPNRSLGQVQ
jgi:hypothetical protein